MPFRLRAIWAATITALAVQLIPAAPAAAATFTHEGGVLRYRADSTERVRMTLEVVSNPEGDAPVSYFRAEVRPVPNAGRGCSVMPFGNGAEVLCGPIGNTDGLPRYRLSLSDRLDLVGIVTADLPGVIYGGAGDDVLEGATRVYGGEGDDTLEGMRAYGGPGDDYLRTDNLKSDRPAVLRGGSGKDLIQGPGWLYGGAGDDDLKLEDTGVRGSDMVVGGRGNDLVDLAGRDSRRDVVRVRGGGSDTVRCAPDGLPPDRLDVLFVDAADRVAPRCRRAQLLLTGRPRLLR